MNLTMTILNLYRMSNSLSPLQTSHKLNERIGTLPYSINSDEVSVSYNKYIKMNGKMM
jgi:hypothetical protein